MKIKQIIQVVAIIALLTGLADLTLAKEEKIEYEKDGITFVVGEHKPEDRAMPIKKIPKNRKALEVFKQPATGKKLRPEEMENYQGDKEKIKENKNINKKLANQKDENNASENLAENADTEKEGIISGLLEKVKEMWEKIVKMEETLKNVVFKVDNLEEKVVDNKEIKNNVNMLSDTTSEITDEISEQDKRIDELEKRILKDNAQEE